MINGIFLSTDSRPTMIQLYHSTQEKIWQNWTPFHDKRSQKTSITGELPQFDKLCLKKLQLTSHLMVRNWTFSLCAHRQNKHVLSSLLVNVLLEFQTTAIRQDRKRKTIQIGKQGIKLFLPTDDMTLHV